MPRMLGRRSVIAIGTLALLGPLGAACARRDLSETPTAAPPAKPAEAKPATAASPAAAQPAAPAPAATVPGPVGSASPTPAAAAVAAKPVGTPKRGGVLNTLVQNDWVRLDPLFDTGSGNGFNMLF